MKNLPVDAVIVEDGGCLVLARLVDWDGQALTPDQTETVEVQVFQLEAESTPTYAEELTVEEVVLESPASGHPAWPANPGYNFRHLVPATAFPTGDHYYRLEYQFTPAVGPRFWLLQQVFAQRVASA